METIRLTGDDWALLRDLRLAALADAPYAYGSSLAAEEAFGEADWRRRVSSGVWVAAVHDTGPVGLIGAYVPAREDTPMIVAMWVAPAARGLGAGDVLITEVLRWVEENRWSRVVLRVADGNGPARKLFLRHGFEPTGRRAPLESDPGVATEVLSRAV